MGSFANTVFSIMLGWLQTLASMLWSAMSGKEGGSLLQFIGKNWIRIAVILCAAGLAADFAVYLFRWAPYKVWRTFWNRIKNNRKPEPAEEYGMQSASRPENREQVPHRYFARQKNSERQDSAYNGPGENPATADTAEQDDLRRWKTEDAETEKEIPTEITRAGYTVPADSPYRKPEAGSRRRKFRINLLGDTEENGEIHYYSPRPMMDKREAYHSPVYPEQWTGSRDQDS